MPQPDPDSELPDPTLRGRKTALMQRFHACRDNQERVALLVRQSRAAPGLPDSDKCPANRVEGCLANLWLVCSFDGQYCRFRSDSDSAIVKGLAGVICDFYSGLPPTLVRAEPPDFLADVGLTQHLTPNRRNSLTRVWETIRSFAEAQIPKTGDAT